MSSWLELRLEFLREEVITLEEKLKEYKEKDVTDFDTFNKNILERTIKSLEGIIAEYKIQIDLIEKGKFDDNFDKEIFG